MRNTRITQIIFTEINMGFGLLLFGLTFLIDYGVVISSEFNIGFDVYPDLIGYIVIFIALRKLTPYGKGFKNAKFMCYPLFLIGLGLIALPLIALAKSHLSLIALLIQYCYIARDIAWIMFSMLLFSGIRELASEVELPKIVKRTTVAFVLGLLYFLPRISIYIINFTQAQKAFVIYWYSLLWYVFLFFSLYLTFNCYMYICYEGEEDPEIKEGRLSRLLDKMKNK